MGLTVSQTKSLNKYKKKQRKEAGKENAVVVEELDRRVMTRVRGDINWLI